LDTDAVLEEIRKTLIDLRLGQTEIAESIKPIKEHVSELRIDMYVGPDSVKPTVARIVTLCDQKCPKGFWAWLSPITQQVVAWVVIIVIMASFLIIVGHRVMLGIGQP
jgi:hypothetical protein